MNLQETLQERNAQILATTEEERENLDETNPIIHAETGPNRFNVMSLFFTDEDGVRIEEDLDLETISVQYFTDTESVEVVEGTPLYIWALTQYKENF